jgi:hypothetical protein
MDEPFFSDGSSSSFFLAPKRLSQTKPQPQLTTQSIRSQPIDVGCSDLPNPKKGEMT